MAGTINKIINLAGNMGWRYISFRLRYELLRRSGLLKSKFPKAPPFKQYITLADWKKQNAVFFFKDRESLAIEKDPQPELKTTYNNIRQGKLLLFNSVLTELGKDYDWVTNPDSDFKYDIKKHWTEIPDYSKEAGDIKFVWEKSRFSYLYDIIRYDHHFGEDCAEFVFSEIMSWIKSNPVNCGPNYRCSQEMSLRVLNWTFALHYYRNSTFLTEEVFNQVQYAIYWHMHHVYKNIDFSRIAVRNNHAITETLALYLAGIFYPTLPGAETWKTEGKKWFEEEIAYQVYDDGTFLQFSMNYHRIVVQLLTWGITLSEKNGEKFTATVYKHAASSLMFLRTCMADENGWLPNYGANDGALFFKLNNAHFRDYRPQLQAFAAVLKIDIHVGPCEDMAWYGIQKEPDIIQIKHDTYSFPKGGYYIIRERDTITFIKCGGYKDRPSHADNLHLDVWHKGENILLDAGSYKYNTDEQTMRYFNGTHAHNTVMLNSKDQMLKGGRFIWYYWPKCIEARLEERDSDFMFTGTINAFRYIGRKIHHRRVIVKQKGRPVWEIRDEVIGAPKSMLLKQIWHLPLVLKNKVTITAKDAQGNELQPEVHDGWNSPLYGQKEKTKEIVFSDKQKKVETVIKVDA
ncbi:MAG: heparinase [Flavipsychrobacter sp.]|jgi:hypothetical protein|nr:heparinase [Flavipsychrobacter sp.]